MTSISIFMRGSARPAEIIIAAGRTSPKYLRKTGQHRENPAASGQMLVALDFFLGPVQQIAVVGPAKGADRALAAIRRGFSPNRVIAFHDPATGAPPAELAALFEGKEAVGGAVTVYVCENFACQAPLVGADAVEKAFA